MVVEFQHSSIHPEEVQSRESFYKRIVWVVDGARSESDRTFFFMGLNKPSIDGYASFEWIGRGKLFNRWHTTKPVFIDFGNEHGFWRVLKFNPSTKRGVVKIVDRSVFCAELSNGVTDFSNGGGPASHPS